MLLILALWAAGLGAAGQFAKVAVIFPYLQELYPGSGASLGFAVSLLSFIGILFGLVAGLLAAQFGFRNLLLPALLLGALVSFWQSSSLPLPVLLASRVVEGLSHLVIVVTAPTLIGRLSPDRYRSAAMVLWSTFFGVAFAVVALIGNPLAATHGPQSLFLAHGVYMAATAILLFFVLPPDSDAAKSKQKLSPAAILQSHWQIYRSPSIAAPASGWLFYTLTFVSLMTVLPDFVAASERKAVAIAMPLAGMLSAMSLGVLLLRWLQSVSVVMLGFSLAALIALAMLAIPGHAILCIALLAALGLVQGASFASIPQLNSSAAHQAYANGAVAQMGNLGNTCGTPLLLVLVGAFEFSGLIGFLLVSYLGGIGIHLWQLRRRRTEDAMLTI